MCLKRHTVQRSSDQPQVKWDASVQLKQGCPKIDGNTCCVVTVVFVGWVEEPHVDTRRRWSIKYFCNLALLAYSDFAVLKFTILVRIYWVSLGTQHQSELKYVKISRAASRGSNTTA